MDIAGNTVLFFLANKRHATGGREFWSDISLELRKCGYEVDALVVSPEAKAFVSRSNAFNNVYDIFADLEALERALGRPAPKLIGEDAYKYVEFDRRINFRSYSFVTRVVEQHYAFVNTLLELRRYKYVVTEISSLISLVLMDVGKRYGTGIVMPLYSFVEGRFFLASSDRENPFPDETETAYLEVVQSGRSPDEDRWARDYVAAVRGKLKPQTLDTEKLALSLRSTPAKNKRAFSALRSPIRRLGGLGMRLANRDARTNDLNYYLLPFMHRYQDPSVTRAEMGYEIPSGNEKFVLYFLQVEPELSTQVWAPYMKDQLQVIRNVAFSLPYGYRLYVKEHPSNGPRVRRFYEEIHSIPQVVFIPPEYPGNNLLNECSAVVTISGTVSWEGLLLGKPVFFMEPRSTPQSCVKGVLDFEGWPKFAHDLKAVLREPLPFGRIDEDSILNYVVALRRCTYPGRWLKTTMNPSDLRCLAQKEATRVSGLEDAENLRTIAASFHERFKKIASSQALDRAKSIREKVAASQPSGPIRG